MSRAEMNQDPVQDQFFAPEGVAEALVREATQNTLDAAIEGQAARLRYTFPSSPLGPQTTALYVEGLAKHIARTAGAAAVPDDPMSFMLVEDFNTRGLRGDPGQEQDEAVPPDGVKNDFFYFWRNIARSPKSETDRGRWGVGKTVFPAASRIYSFFGLTIRSDDHRALLMGQSVLKVHTIGKERYCPYPYFGNTSEDGFTMPVEDASFLQAFGEHFKLSRKDEPGLSIVIPYPRGDELQPAAVLRAAIRNYFFSILGGTLVVEVNDQGAVTSLNPESLRSITKQLDWSGSGVTVPELLELFDMASWALSLPADKHLKLAPQAKGAPSWGDSYFKGLDIQKLRQSFENGERMGFLVPVKVERKKQEPKTAWFKSYICKDPSLKTGEDHYIRQGITVTKIRQLKESNVRGLVVVDDKDLSALLGDAEEPAHTDWLERAAKLKQGFEHGPSCVRFVKQALRQLVEQLSRPPEGMKEELLKDLFFIDRPLQAGGEGRDKEGEDEGNQPPQPLPELPPPPPPNLLLQRTDGGFKITGRPGLRGDVLVELAYAVRRGNAFRKYDPNDFDLGDGSIQVECDGAHVVLAERNTLLLAIERDGFEVRVLGFDPNRDLRVRGNPVGAVQQASAAEAERVVA